MRKVLAVALVACACLVAAGAAARAQDAGARARELAARFDKDKHKVKEKRGVRVEVFLEMRGEPAPRANPADYSGAYESEPGYAFDLRVSADGGAAGKGFEPSPGGPRRFTLRDARVSGAVLAGTKVFEDGSAERFEGVFINLSVRSAPADKGTTLFGLGAVFETPKNAGGYELSKLFYALKR
jgi:hypothetical protein